MRTPTKVVIRKSALSQRIPFYIIIVLVSLVTRLFSFSRHSLWLDEVSYIFYRSLDLTDIRSLFAFASGVHHPPLYIWIHAAWLKLFGISEIAVISLSIIASCLALALFYSILKELGLDSIVALTLTIFLNFVPLFHHYSLDATEYMFFSLLLLSTLYVYLIFVRRRDTASALLLSFCCFVLVYFHYYGLMYVGIVYASIIMISIIERKAYLISAPLAFLPLFTYPLYKAPQAALEYGGDVVSQSFSTWYMSLTTLVEDMYGVAYPAFRHLGEGQVLMPLAFLAVVILLCLGLLVIVYQIILLSFTGLGRDAPRWLRHRSLLLPEVRKACLEAKGSKRALACRELWSKIYRWGHIFLAIFIPLAALAFVPSTIRLKALVFWVPLSLLLWVPLFRLISLRRISVALIILLIVPNLFMLNIIQQDEEDWKGLAVALHDSESDIVIPVRYTYFPFLYYYDHDRFVGVSQDIPVGWQGNVIVVDSRRDNTLLLDDFLTHMSFVDHFYLVWTDHMNHVDPYGELVAALGEDFEVVGEQEFGRIVVYEYVRHI